MKLHDFKQLQAKVTSEKHAHDFHDSYRILVGTATCGIAAGAVDVLKAFEAAQAKYQGVKLVVTAVGCIGYCAFEPLVEIVNPDGHRTTYCQVGVDDVERLIEEHILKHQVVASKVLETHQKLEIHYG